MLVRGVAVSYETIRHLDEVFVGINGRLRYLWRAVDQHGNVLDILCSRVATRWRPGGFSVRCVPNVEGGSM